ncbi:hypothetical protein MMC34_000033 [Xylographa carneopallida]|nr:hypothetical protein [Xylographa carneopallida]
MTPELEILVHISAPSRIVDDGKYRKQALGFLNFQAATTHGAEPCNEVPEQLVPVTPYPQSLGRHTSLAQRLYTEGDQSASKDVLVESSFCDEGSWYGSVPPAPTYPRSRIPRTIYTTSRVLVARTPAIARPQTAPAPASPSLQGPPHRRSQSDSWQTPPSVVPDSQPERSQLKRSFPEQSSFSSSAGLSSPSAKRQRGFPADEPLVEHTQRSTRSAEDVPAAGTIPPPESSPTWATPSPESSASIANERVEVHAPPPKTSLASFTTHISPSLALIEAKLPIAKLFNPPIKTRELRTLERGHWQLLLDHQVPVAEREKFWEFLRQFISEGRAGWGVWAEKCAKKRHLMGGELVLEEEPAGVGDEIVRVYCWGEVVGYIYILLFMGSHRKIRGMDARWIDAGGEVVIRMDEYT